MLNGSKNLVAEELSLAQTTVYSILQKYFITDDIVDASGRIYNIIVKK